MSVYQVTRVEIQRVSGAGKRDQARLTICAYSAPSTRRKPNTLEREMVGNNCRGQIYSVFSTIMGDAWHANPRIIPIPHRFITHSHCFVPFFSRKRNTPFHPSYFHTRFQHVSRIACAHDPRITSIRFLLASRKSEVEVSWRDLEMVSLELGWRIWIDAT